MGELDTVDLGTAVHEGILRSSGILDSGSRYGYPLPASRHLIGVYVDDLLVLLPFRRQAAKLLDIDTDTYGLPPLPPTSDFLVFVLGDLDCGFVVLWFVSLGM